MPVNGLNLFSRSNCCFPRAPRSTFRSGQIAYSSIVLLIWKILSVIASGAGPGNQTMNSGSFCAADMKTERTQSLSILHSHICHSITQEAKYQDFLIENITLMITHALPLMQNEEGFTCTKRNGRIPSLSKDQNQKSDLQRSLLLFYPTEHKN